LADVDSLKDREDVIIGGIVTAVRTRFDKRGNPCGFVTLEDFKGSGELALFGEDWGRWSGMFTEGASVYITAKVQPRFQYSDIMSLKVQNIEYLQTVKDKAIDRITISLTTDLLNDAVVMELGELINESPGTTKLFFQLHDSTGKKHVLLRSASKSVDVRSSLIQYIEQTEALDYKIN
jgi:DNA polymerase-3 subunit alpha